MSLKGVSPSLAMRALLIGALLFGAGYYAGGHGTTQTVDGADVGRAVDLDNFWQTKRLVEEKYVQDVNSQDLITGASKGLVSGTGDPYSAYLTADEAKELNNALAGEVEGVGIEVGVRDGQVTVVAPLPGSPAEKAGIKAGDIIVAVDDTATQGQALDAVVKKIRGAKGTQVKLTVATPGQEPRQLTITRETVKSASVKLTYQNNVAVIDLSRFGDDTKEGMAAATADILAKNPQGVILDLRGNPGGFLDGAIDVTSLFLQEGTVVKEQFKDHTDEKKVTGNAPLAKFPLVILVDKGSASAAEITAGALRDERGIKLVGVKTFGKGSVQELMQLADSHVLKLTIAEWLTPKGTSISKQGLEPDIKIEGEAVPNGPDPQLQAALAELLK